MNITLSWAPILRKMPIHTYCWLQSFVTNLPIWTQFFLACRWFPCMTKNHFKKSVIKESPCQSGLISPRAKRQGPISHRLLISATQVADLRTQWLYVWVCVCVCVPIMTSSVLLICIQSSCAASHYEVEREARRTSSDADEEFLRSVQPAEKLISQSPAWELPWSLTVQCFGPLCASDSSASLLHPTTNFCHSEHCVPFWSWIKCACIHLKWFFFQYLIQPTHYFSWETDGVAPISQGIYIISNWILLLASQQTMAEHNIWLPFFPSLSHSARDAFKVETQFYIYILTLEWGMCLKMKVISFIHIFNLFKGGTFSGTLERSPRDGTQWLNSEVWYLSIQAANRVLERNCFGAVCWQQLVFDTLVKRTVFENRSLLLSQMVRFFFLWIQSC